MTEHIITGDLDVANLKDLRNETYRVQGSVNIREKIENCVDLTIVARGDVHIGQKIDQHATNITIDSAQSVFIGEKIDQHSSANIKAARQIHIEQKVDQHSTATLSAPEIRISQGVSEHSSVYYHASTWTCGEVDHTSKTEPF